MSNLYLRTNIYIKYYVMIMFASTGATPTLPGAQGGVNQRCWNSTNQLKFHYIVEMMIFILGEHAIRTYKRH